MYCTWCGKELPDEANFCLQCGSPQSHETPSDPDPAGDDADVLYEVHYRTTLSYRLYRNKIIIDSEKIVGRHKTKQEIVNLSHIRGIKERSGIMTKTIELEMTYQPKKVKIYCEDEVEVQGMAQAIRDAIAAL